MKHILTLLMLFFVSTGHAQEITKTELPKIIYDNTVEQLLRDVKEILDVELPDEKPKIYVASIEQIRNVYCEEKTHCNVGAITDRTNGDIILNVGFLPNNLYTVSILFHELVHWVQVKNKMFENETECMFWAKSEMHAYQAQSKFIEKNGGRPFEISDLTLECQ